MNIKLYCHNLYYQNIEFYFDNNINLSKKCHI